MGHNLKGTLIPKATLHDCDTKRQLCTVVMPGPLLSMYTILQVWLATCKPLGEQVALKILELDNMAVDLVSSLMTSAAWVAPHPQARPTVNTSVIDSGRSLTVYSV